MATMLSRLFILTAVTVSMPAWADGYGGPYGFGSTPSVAEIAAIDIDIMPDGAGLPPGRGDPARGAVVYADNCAVCHGENLEGIVELGAARLIGGRGSLASDAPVKTVESYWPYATTLFDYIRRAMPLPAPGSLGDEDVYALSAFILSEAGIVDPTAVMDADSLPAVAMPNRDGFYPDPRPDVFNYD